MSSRLTILLISLWLFSTNGLASGGPSGWDPDNAYEVDPCAWAIVRAHDLYEDERFQAGKLDLETPRPTATDIVDALRADGKMEAFAKSADQLAKRLLGIPWQPLDQIQLVKRADLPSFDFSYQQKTMVEAAPHLTPRVRKSLNELVQDPDESVFSGLLNLMVSRRIAELRYAEEVANTEAQALFQGHPVTKVHLVGTLGPYHQAFTPQYFLGDRKPKEPVVSLVRTSNPMRSSELRSMSAIIRNQFDFEFFPFANEAKLNFNTDVFRYSGMFDASDGFCEDSDDILVAIESALSFPGREEVTIEVPITNQYIWEKMGVAESMNLKAVEISSVAYHIGFKALANQGFRPTHEKSQQAIREFLSEIAFGMTKETRTLTATGNQPGDIMGEPEVITPDDTFSANYTVVLRRRDNKRIRIQFTGPINLFEYAQRLTNGTR